MLLNLKIKAKIDLMNKAIGYCNDDSFLYNFRSILLSETGDIEAASYDIEKAINIEPKSPNWHYNFGLLQNKMGRYLSAVASYQKAVEIENDFHEAWNNLGITYYYLKDYILSIEAYYKAIEIKPNYSRAWNNLAMRILG